MTFQNDEIAAFLKLRIFQEQSIHEPIEVHRPSSMDSRWPELRETNRSSNDITNRMQSALDIPIRWSTWGAWGLK